MTDLIIGLIPDYGLYVLFVVVSLACLAVPLPSSMLVLASGAFVASGDLALWQVLLVAFAAFIVGDQIAFRIAAGVGPKFVAAIRRKPKLVPVLEKSEALLEKRGQVAVLLSHTVLSPTCPYISYLCGAGGMAWAGFTVVATIGAAIWVSAYVGLGLLFATQLTQVATILSNFFGIVLAGCFGLGCLIWLRKSWRMHLQKQKNAQSGT